MFKIRNIVKLSRALERVVLLRLNVKDYWLRKKVMGDTLGWKGLLFIRIATNELTIVWS